MEECEIEKTGRLKNNSKGVKW